nr:hypothetical protein [uncultured Parasphingorhabdus sp.]
MSTKELETTPHPFVNIGDHKDTEWLAMLLHPDFTWYIAVPPPAVPEKRPMYSKLPKELNLPWEQAIYSKAETITIFRTFLSPFRNW